MKIKITTRMLKSLGACLSAIRFLKSVLPATVSTDPDDNFDLAIRVISLYDNKRSCVRYEALRCRRNLVYDLSWLLHTKGLGTRIDDVQSLNLFIIGRLDILEVSQMLSFIAEKA